jgi:hypothetical protein
MHITFIYIRKTSQVINTTDGPRNFLWDIAVQSNDHVTEFPRYRTNQARVCPSKTSLRIRCDFSIAALLSFTFNSSVNNNTTAYTD